MECPFKSSLCLQKLKTKNNHTWVLNGKKKHFVENVCFGLSFAHWILRVLEWKGLFDLFCFFSWESFWYWRSFLFSIGWFEEFAGTENTPERFGYHPWKNQKATQFFFKPNSNPLVRWKEWTQLDKLPI